MPLRLDASLVGTLRVKLPATESIDGADQATGLAGTHGVTGLAPAMLFEIPSAQIRFQVHQKVSDYPGQGRSAHEIASELGHSRSLAAVISRWKCNRLKASETVLKRRCLTDAASVVF